MKKQEKSGGKAFGASSSLEVQVLTLKEMKKEHPEALVPKQLPLPQLNLGSNAAKEAADETWTTTKC